SRRCCLFEPRPRETPRSSEASGREAVEVEGARRICSALVAAPRSLLPGRRSPLPGRRSPLPGRRSAGPTAYPTVSGAGGERAGQGLAPRAPPFLSSSSPLRPRSGAVGRAVPRRARGLLGEPAGQVEPFQGQVGGGRRQALGAVRPLGGRALTGERLPPGVGQGGQRRRIGHRPERAEQLAGRDPLA